MQPKIVIVAALGKNRELGKGDELIWHIPDDLKRFKELTLGHPVIMGRKTFESIVRAIGKPLPNRTNIVVTRGDNYSHAGVTVVHSLEEGISEAKKLNPSEIHIGGGAQLYIEALRMVDQLRLTRIDAEADADTYFPPYEHEFTVTAEGEDREWNGLQFRFVDLERKK
jgi:dihydrofolate reductase